MISNLSATIQRTQDIADAVSKIKQSSIDGASKRKEIAAAKLQELRERLRIMLLFSNVGSKGNAAAAAQLAKELAAAVKEYASASGVIQEAGGDAASASSASAVAKADTEFITGAKQLATQIKAFIASEVQKAKRHHKHEDAHEKTISELNSAIDDASKSLGLNSSITPAYTVDISVATVSVSG